MVKEFIKKHWKLISAGVLILLALVALIYFIRPSESNTANLQERKPNRTENGQTCEEKETPVFAADFVDAEKIKYLAPIGSINAGSPGRAYVFVKGEQGSRNKVTVYAPADMTLEGIVFARRNPNDPNAPGEYRLDFRISCDVTLHFDHLDEVVDEIKTIAPTVPEDNTRNAKRVKLTVTAGQVVAYTDGTAQSGGFDFFVIDKTKKAFHINPSRWAWEQTTFATCPYDYFEEGLKTKYYGMLRSHDGQVLSPLSCGNPSHDVPGTASGGWFQADSTDSNGKWLEIGNQNGKVELIIRNKGNHEFKIRDYKPKILPEKLNVGSATCYSGDGNWAYIDLNTNDKLRLAKGVGTCPSLFPTGTSEIWER